MKIGGNEQINTPILNTSSEVKNTPKEEVRIGDYLANNSSEVTNSNSASGKSAEVELSNKIEKSIIPGFTKQNITIKTASGVEFNATLHVQANTDKEQAKILSDKITKIVSNLPPQVLEDIKEELRHITICPNIILNKDAKALAVSELNQIFLSAEVLSGASEKDIEETITHELGHLIDRREGTFEGKWSEYCKNSFDNLKKSLTPDLGFEKDVYTMSNPRECFADYYLYKCGAPSDNHRSKQLFDKLQTYYNDVSNLSSEELQAKYGENTNAVKSAAEKWSKLQKEFDFVLTGTQSGKYQRLKESVEPLSIEQMTEINEQNIKN